MKSAAVHCNWLSRYVLKYVDECMIFKMEVSIIIYIRDNII